MIYPKRLIEVDLPIKRISAHSRREKSIRHGHISTLHIWWARRPLAACRAVICAALWPDPADEHCPPAFLKAARKIMLDWGRDHMELASAETLSRLVAIQKNKSQLDDPLELRGALLDFIADFSNWDNSTGSAYLATSRALTQIAHESLGGAARTRPLIVDPFAGGGAIPLEALRIGADAFASDLNPVPVLLNRVALEYIPKYGERLVSEVRCSLASLRAELEQELRHYYFTGSASEGRQVFFWARVIHCEGPACGYTFPLLRSLWLRQKAKRGVAFSLVRDEGKRAVVAEIVEPGSHKDVGEGTSKKGAATCPVCGFTTPVESVRQQLSKKRGGAADAQFLAVGYTKNGEVGKHYRRPNQDELNQAEKAKLDYLRLRDSKSDEVAELPDEKLNHLRGFFNVVLYGMHAWGDLFSPRQALLMTKITSLIKKRYSALTETDSGFATAVATCLALAVGKVAQYNSSCCRWKPTGETVVDMFGRQAIPMVWDFAEAYPFGRSTGDLGQYAESFRAVLENLVRTSIASGVVVQASATRHPLPDDSVDALVTDPPYYDAIPYADLSDFFYVWLRRMLGPAHPSLLSDDLSPKDDECVTLAHRAAMYRHKDRNFFEKTMTMATSEGRRYTKPTGIGVVVFANKSTAGWEAMLGALVESGWTITASWPIDTEMSSRLRAQDSAALASSVHLVCRPRENPDGSLCATYIGDWRDVLCELPRRIHEWMPRLAEEGVVGADAIFACLGPALEIFSRYSRVEKASGEVVPLREYLEQVWAAVAKEALAQVFKDADTASFEPDARLTAMWLWTLNAGQPSPSSILPEGDGSGEADEEEETKGKSAKAKGGFVLEYDAARKIAQGLGAYLEDLTHVVEVSGDTARLLPVSERTSILFGKEQAAVPTGGRKKKPVQMNLYFELTKAGSDDKAWSETTVKKIGETTLDRVHQAMILFAAGRGEALKRFLVEDGVGRDQRFWRLAQALSALYPSSTSEKRWVDGVLARKKGLGL